MTFTSEKTNGQNVISHTQEITNFDELDIRQEFTKINKRLEQIENSVFKPESLANAEVGEFDFSRTDMIDIKTKTNQMVIRRRPWNVRNIEFPGTIITLFDTGEWQVECLCRNVSRHSNWWVYHRIICFGSRTGSELFKVPTWDGRFGAGYEETKKASGHSDKIREYWQELRNGEVYMSQGSTIDRV